LLVGAALLPVLSVALDLLQSGLPAWREADAITAFDRRLAPLRTALGTRSTVGYLPPPAADAKDSAAGLYLTRYALAPVLVLEDPGQPVIVADGVRDPAALPSTHEVARDFGGGLLLLRQRSR
jgi:hypothetical protein